MFLKKLHDSNIHDLKYKEYFLALTVGCKLLYRGLPKKNTLAKLSNQLPKKGGSRKVRHSTVKDESGHLSFPSTLLAEVKP